MSNPLTSQNGGGMATGLDTIRNPSGTGGGTGHDFIKDPSVDGAAPPAPEQAPPQKSGEPEDINSESRTGGGLYPHKDGSNVAGDIGTGSLGNGHKPYTLRG